ncbi:MAG TPA: hypothetical protein VGN69_02360 [Solirubrobacteraceae bacterium]|nr:hypothetical protein [Solirubrobacteraceae bacterium]
MPGPETVTLPARAWAVMAIVVVMMFVIFGFMLASIESQRQHVIDQDRKVSILFDQVHPLLQAAPPLVRSAQPLLAQAARLAGPLMRGGARVSRLLSEASALFAQAARLLVGLSRSDAPGALAAAGALARSIDRHNPTGLIDAGRALLSEIADRNLLAKAQAAAEVAPRLEGLQRRQIRLQLQSLAVQRATLRAQLRGLAVQEESLKHVASLDRRTGGQITPAPTPAIP